MKLKHLIRQTTSEADPKWATAEQLARRYAVSVRTVKNWQAAKTIPFRRVSARLIRFPVDECDAILDERFAVNPKTRRNK